MRDDVPSKPCPAILDCTLRDGSYVVDFGFTAGDTYGFAERLFYLGFPFIEVGHGIGLGASRKGMGVSAASDEEYMEAARDCSVRFPDGKWGMFCIPGVASLEDVDLAASYDMGFIRIGCEVSNVESAKPFIERARHHGIYVFSNLMKSYAASPSEFAKQASKCVEYGAQCVYIVDSAGGMLPGDIGAYANALRDLCPDVRLGFHGHNNLGLAVANALHSADLGFGVIDVSLQGLGRSGGNVPSEQFISALIVYGQRPSDDTWVPHYDVPYDPVAVMQAGDDLVRQYVQPISSLDVTAGLAQFHSSYMPRILDVAKARRVDPRRLILAVSERDKLNAPLELIEECAAQLEGMAPSSALITKPYYGQEQS
jgi:4-hydroxy-2-oxovalerate aldolase